MSCHCPAPCEADTSNVPPTCCPSTSTMKFGSPCQASPETCSVSPLPEGGGDEGGGDDGGGEEGGGDEGGALSHGCDRSSAGSFVSVVLPDCVLGPFEIWPAVKP